MRLFPLLPGTRNISIRVEFFRRRTDNSGNKTRQGYARKRTLKPAGYFFLGCETC